jgi:hypothetical protein
MLEVRVFLILRAVKGGGDQIVAARLSRGAAEALVAGRPDLRIKREFATKLDRFSDTETLRLIPTEKAA